LNCSNNKITKLPFLPKLNDLNCSNTLITKLPEIKNCFIIANRCRWLNPDAKLLNKIIIIQKLIKQHIKKRVQIIHKAMHTHTDIVHVLN
jgi:Leucine-rich repeat (LRR) protein